MTIEEIIKEAFSQGWNASHECATDFDYEYALKNCLSELGSEVKKLNIPAVSGGWFDFYGSKNENRNIVYPKINENVEFETTKGLTLKGEFTNKPFGGVFWAKHWGYFYGEQVVRWRSSDCH